MLRFNIPRYKPDMERLKRSISQIWDKKTESKKPTGLSLWRTISETSLFYKTRTSNPRDDTAKMESCNSTATLQRPVKVKRLSTVGKEKRTPLRPAIKTRTHQEGNEIRPSNEGVSIEVGRATKRVHFSTYTLLLESASENSVKELRTLLDKYPSYVNKPSSSGATALHKAAVQGHLECVRLLLDRGADPNLLDKQGRTPMLLAWKNQHTASFKLMLKTAVAN